MVEMLRFQSLLGVAAHQARRSVGAERAQWLSKVIRT